MRCNNWTGRFALIVITAASLSACAATVQSTASRSSQPTTSSAQTPGALPTSFPPVYAPYAARPEGPLDPVAGTYKVDAIDFTLLPGDSGEYKYRLVEGATMIYQWKADGPVRFDFHTVPDGKPASASERFEAGETTQVSGVYKAPYTGLHGWWWQNAGKEIVNIRIQTAGFYSQAMMFGGGPDGTPVDVQDPPPPVEP